jgi:hypothetical protein
VVVRDQPDAIDSPEARRTAGNATTLYYAAGPDDERHGLFGKITANPAGTSPVQATPTAASLVITCSRNDDHIEVQVLQDSQTVLVLSRAPDWLVRPGIGEHHSLQGLRR